MRAIQHFYKKFGRYPTKRRGTGEYQQHPFSAQALYRSDEYRDPANRQRRGLQIPASAGHQLEQRAGIGATPGQSGLAGQGASGIRRIRRDAGRVGRPQSGLGGFGAQPGGLQPTVARARRLRAGSSADSFPAALRPAALASRQLFLRQLSDAEGSLRIGQDRRLLIPVRLEFRLRLNGQTFGGGPILGVASTSKAKRFACSTQEPLQRLVLHLYANGRHRRPADRADQSWYANRQHRWAHSRTDGGGALGQGGTGQSGLDQDLGQGQGGGQSPILQPAPQTPAPTQGPSSRFRISGETLPDSNNRKAPHRARLYRDRENAPQENPKQR